MTPQLTPQSNLASSGRTHLTEDQFAELLAASTPTADSDSALVEAHLLHCKECVSELATLRESVALFRHAASAYADHELRRIPEISIPRRRFFSPALGPAHWIAAAAILLVALLPMQISRQLALQRPSHVTAVTSNASESDEALLDEVDRYTSASVPTPMQALADPTTSVSTTTTTQSSAQRKD